MKKILIEVIFFLFLVYFLAVDISDGVSHVAHRFWGALVCAPIFLILIIKDVIFYLKKK